MMLSTMYQYKNQAVPDFLSREAPPNYVAGLGRGATGFTTRSDIGPARENVEFPEKAAAGGDGTAKADDDDERFQDPDNERGLFNALPYEADDEEADRIYEEVDKKMDERRRARREAREREEIEKYRKERPKIQQQFADLKRSLSTITDDEWANIPEVGDMVRKKSKRNHLKEKYAPVPDSVLISATQKTEYTNAIDPRQQMLGGFQTPSSGTATELTDFVQFGQDREKVLGIKLDQISDSVSGQTTIDPKGYLTDLNSIVVKSDAEISDIKKARTLLRSVTSTNPKHAPGWIAAARLEEVAGKMAAAREVIAKGCEECPTSDDVWLEAARLNTIDNAKVILANAVKNIPQSVKIWLRATELEVEPLAKKRVLRRALEFIPNSVKIWKAAVSLEDDPDDARILLSRAVECVPLSVELWLALARLESYENAKKILNKARRSVGTSHEIWISAAKLEEQQGNNHNILNLIEKAVTLLAERGAGLDREQWIKEAETCEKEGAILTCQAIISATIGLGLDDEDRKPTWMDDAESCIAHGSIACARAVYAHALTAFPKKKSIWRRSAYLEKSHGTFESLDNVLKRAVEECPNAEVLWLMYAKENWLAGDVEGARRILRDAFKTNQNSEQLWLAAIKLEVETGNVENARSYLTAARSRANTMRVWMKSAVFERQLKDTAQALGLLEDALQKFPTFDKLWMIRGQIEDEDLGKLDVARETFASGLKKCPKSIPLWLLASRLEEKLGLLIKARAILEKARLLNPKNAELWAETVRVELRGKNQSMAKAMMAKALQECPNSGLLWSEAILMEVRPQRKAKSADALRKCENDPVLITAVARLFWAERKIDKARNWFQRAVKIDPDIGDTWAWYLKFEIEHGTKEQAQSVISRCRAAEPHHGERWCRAAKSMKNVGKKTDEILQIIASELEQVL